MSRVNTFVEAESRVMVGRGWEEEWGVTTMGTGILGGDENVL
jgi:hypothetical protein